MTAPRNQIMYRQVGNTEIWVNRISTWAMEVVVYDHIDKTMKNVTGATLDDAMTTVSVAITRELRRQQGEA